MNIDTGEIGGVNLPDEYLKQFVVPIKKFQSFEEMKKAGFTEPLKHPPNPNCVKCSGKGHDGPNLFGKFEPCSCTQ